MNDYASFLNCSMLFKQFIKVTTLTFFLVFGSFNLASAQTKSETVYITDTGHKYHKGKCHHLKYSKHKIDKKSARKKGYTACKVCKPDGTSTKKTYSNSGTKTTATQCTGYTQKGNRCKRKTKSASGRCYQHEK